MSSLSRLEEGAGIKIVTSLAEIPAQLAAVLGVRLMTGEEQQVEVVIGKWESGQSQHPITWRSLLDILKELKLEDLSQEIEDYMHGEQGICMCAYNVVHQLCEHLAVHSVGDGLSYVGGIMRPHIII